MIYDQPNNESFTQKIERIQYNAALVITGAIKETSQSKLYSKLGFESLKFRRWFRKLCIFFKIRELEIRIIFWHYSNNSPEEQLKLWKNHFEQLLGQLPVLNDQPIERVFNMLPIESGDFMADKLIALQNNKAPEQDGIPIEMWKTGCLDEELLEICSKTFDGDVPGIWLQDGIQPFSKKRRFRHY